MPQSKLPIVVLISGGGSNLQAIIDTTARGELQCNRQDRNRQRRKESEQVAIN